MTDAGNSIYIDIQSSEIMALEDVNSAYRFNLGYISGEFSDIYTEGDLYVRVYFKRGVQMKWERVEFKLIRNRKTFRQKLPPGLTVTNFFVQLCGYVVPNNDAKPYSAFELTDFEISVKKVFVGKHGGEPLSITLASPAEVDFDDLLRQ